MEVKKRIAAIVENMQFERKQPFVRSQKDAYSALLHELGNVRDDLNRLHLGLWYALWHKDYSSLFSIRGNIGDIAKRLEELSKK